MSGGVEPEPAPAAPDVPEYDAQPDTSRTAGLRHAAEPDPAAVPPPPQEEPPAVGAETSFVVFDDSPGISEAEDWLHTRTERASAEAVPAEDRFLDVVQRRLKHMLHAEMTRLSKTLRQDMRDELHSWAPTREVAQRQATFESMRGSLSSTTGPSTSGLASHGLGVAHNLSSRPRAVSGDRNGRSHKAPDRIADFSFLDRHRKLGCASELEQHKSTQLTMIGTVKATQEYKRRHGSSRSNPEEDGEFRVRRINTSMSSDGDGPLVVTKQSTFSAIKKHFSIRNFFGFDDPEATARTEVPLPDPIMESEGSQQFMPGAMPDEESLPNVGDESLPANVRRQLVSMKDGGTESMASEGRSKPAGRVHWGADHSMSSKGSRKQQLAMRDMNSVNSLGTTPVQKRVGSFIGEKETSFFPGKDRLAGMQRKLGLQHARTQILKPSRLRQLHNSLHFFVSMVVLDEKFDYLVGLLILTNSVMMGLQVELASREGTINSESNGFFRTASLIFCLVFLTEIVLRMYVRGFQYFSGSDGRWNILDLLVVGLQVTEELVTAIAKATSSKSGLPNSYVFLRVVRALRLVRIIRVVRVMHLLRELRSMISSVAGTLRSLMWTVVLLMLIMYMGAVYLTQLISDHGLTHPEMVRPGTRLHEHYGTLGRSLLTLFMSITGGIDWQVAMEPLKDDISPLLALLFASFVAFMLFSMLNVITGIFVESALSHSKEESDVDMVNYLHSVFVLQGGDGKITWDEFKMKLDDSKMRSYFKSINLDVSEAQFLFELLDLDKTGSIDAEDFVMGCLRLRGPAQAIDLASLMSETRRLRLILCEHIFAVEDALLSKEGASTSGTVISRMARRLSTPQLIPSFPELDERPSTMSHAASTDSDDQLGTESKLPASVHGSQSLFCRHK